MLGVGDVDARRFRMLIELDGAGAHEEDTWIGCQIGLGGAVLRDQRARPALRDDDPRPRNRRARLDTLRAIKEYRGQVDGKDLMFGVWGEVERPGVIRLGDEVRVLA